MNGVTRLNTISLGKTRTGFDQQRFSNAFNGNNINTYRHAQFASALSGKNKTDIVFNSIHPAYQFLRFFGNFPITRLGPGRAYFKLLSTSFLYSTVVFALISVYVSYVTYMRIRLISNLEGRFEESVIAYLFLVNVLPIFITPIIWTESQKVAAFFNDWSDFETLFHRISARRLPLKLRHKGLILSIILPVLSIASVVVTHLTMSDFNLIQVIPYCLLDNMTIMLGAFWYLVCQTISESASILAEHFQKALKHIGPAVMIADYRSLWLQLSKLTRNTGTALCYSVTYLNLYLFFVITLSIYGLMSQISEGFGIKDIGLAVTAISNVCLLFFICDEAHSASQHVKTNFQKKLLMVELSWMNSDAQTEINMFLRATEMNSSSINCGGFFNVNRNLFKSLLTTMVTYLVVLLQFQISIPDDNSIQSNATKAM